MIKEFIINNFTSFKEEMQFSMEADADRVSEHKNHIVEVNDNTILKVASMYGPNGGGKSNVLRALRLVKDLQFNEGFGDISESVCLFGESNIIEETIFFIDEQYEIGYKFSISPSEIEREETIESSIRYMPIQRQYYDILMEEISYRIKGESEFKQLFSRDKYGEILSENFNNIIERKDFKLAKRMSVVRYFYNTFANVDGDLPEVLDVIKHLMIQIYQIESLDRYNRVIRSNNLIKLVQKHEKQLISYLKKIDIDIKAIKTYEKRRYPIYFVREIKRSGRTIDKELSLASESSGTQKVFWMLLEIIENVKNSKIFYCDDMNAYLHPKLFRAIVELFQENESNSQLIFNSHDLINMDNSLFRRDEIWFVYRNDNYSTQLITLANIENYKGEQVRKDAKYYKQYLEGKYGADPFIQRGLKFHE